MIYFIQEAGNVQAPIKIGFTSGKPADRLASLQTGYPKRLAIMACREGGPPEEGEEHAKWSTLRLHGEWFKSDPALIEYIANLSANAPESGTTAPACERRPVDAKTVPWRHVPLYCKVCDLDVLEDRTVLANVEWDRNEDDSICRVWWRHKKCLDVKGAGWEDLGDLCNPMVFIDFWMTSMNGLQTAEQRFSSQAYEDWKTMLLALAGRVFRPVTVEESRHVSMLQQLPRAFGGLG